MAAAATVTATTLHQFRHLAGVGPRASALYQRVLRECRRRRCNTVPLAAVEHWAGSRNAWRLINQLVNVNLWIVRGESVTVLGMRFEDETLTKEKTAAVPAACAPDNLLTRVARQAMAEGFSRDAFEIVAQFHAKVGEGPEAALQSLIDGRNESVEKARAEREFFERDNAAFNSLTAAPEDEPATEADLDATAQELQLPVMAGEGTMARWRQMQPIKRGELRRAVDFAKSKGHKPNGWGWVLWNITQQRAGRLDGYGRMWGEPRGQACANRAPRAGTPSIMPGRR